MEAAFKHLGIDLNATFATEVQQTTGLWHVPEDQATTVTVNKLFARVFLTVLEVCQRGHPRALSDTPGISNTRWPTT